MCYVCCTTSVGEIGRERDIIAGWRVQDTLNSCSTHGFGEFGEIFDSW